MDWLRQGDYSVYAPTGRRRGAVTGARNRRTTWHRLGVVDSAAVAVQPRHGGAQRNVKGGLLGTLTDESGSNQKPHCTTSQPRNNLGEQ